MKEWIIRDKIINQLRATRIEKGLSQRDIAHMIGCRQGTICDMENYKYIPRLNLVINYANALGYDIELSLGGR